MNYIVSHKSETGLGNHLNHYANYQIPLLEHPVTWYEKWKAAMGRFTATC